MVVPFNQRLSKSTNFRSGRTEKVAGQQKRDSSAMKKNYGGDHYFNVTIVTPSPPSARSPGRNDET